MKEESRSVREEKSESSEVKAPLRSAIIPPTCSRRRPHLTCIFCA